MRKGFTLIELLIVVAIIAILAAIAVPNFLEAQTRAKVSRAKADLRSLATGLEVFYVDNNMFPRCNNWGYAGRLKEHPAVPENWVLESLSTPIAYLTSGFLPDPFNPTVKRNQHSVGNPMGNPHTAASVVNNLELARYCKYVSITAAPGSNEFALYTQPNRGKAKAYITYTAGPMRWFPGLDPILDPSTSTPELVSAQFYDPTNGTVSYGYIFRVGGQRGSGADYGSAFWNQAPSK